MYHKVSVLFEINYICCEIQFFIACDEKEDYSELVKEIELYTIEQYIRILIDESQLSQLEDSKYVIITDFEHSQGILYITTFCFIFNRFNQVNYTIVKVDQLYANSYILYISYSHMVNIDQ